MTHASWEDHDSLLDKIEIDVVAQIVTVHLQSYFGSDRRSREPATITFTGVKAVTTAADLLDLAANTFAGHLNHAHLAERGGTSHFYLVEGYIAVTSTDAPQLSRLSSA